MKILNPRQGRVILEIYNLLGQKVITLADKVQSAGEYHVSWDGRDDAGNPVSSGIYFYRLATRETTGGKSHAAAKKMILMK